MPRGIYERTPKIRAAIRKARLGTRSSEETKKKLRMIQKIKSASPVWRKRVSDATLIAMRKPSVRRKHLAGLRKARKVHGVNFKGGNGQPLTIFIKRMAQILEPLGYIREYAIGGLGRKGNYKIDFALPDQKIAVECDGPSHWPALQKQRDVRKTSVLKKLGWTVIRVPHD
jgi:hypothetical protein